MGTLDGRVAIVTGGGRGIGRAEAHRLAAEGARVVVNDLGGSLIGEGGDRQTAEGVVEEIRAAGGHAVADTGDITEWETGRRLVGLALDRFGRLDVLVNNAGIARPRMSFNMSEDDWDLVTKIHLTGSFTATRFAAEHWRDEAKHGDGAVDAAVVFTTSVNGLRGVPGHVNYAAAKAGVAAMTTVLAAELAPYGVRCNAIAPLAYTRMTEELHDTPMFAGDRREALAPDHIAEVVVWLASPRAAGINGRVVGITGERLDVWEGWHQTAEVSVAGRWTQDGLDAVREQLFG
jgi:NAD(P)-dependent dehydrogenase (short-subunit alcohol dehydrogenase family)